MTPALDKAIRAGYAAGHRKLEDAIIAALRTLAEPDEAGIEAAGYAVREVEGYSPEASWNELARAAITAYINKVLGESQSTGGYVSSDIGHAVGEK